MGGAADDVGRTLLSPERRRADRARLADGVVDVLVIGGGVTGAGAALDAASRGLSVALRRGARPGGGHVQPVQQADPRRPALPGAARPSRWSHEALHERGLLPARLAPHLVGRCRCPCPAAADRRPGVAARLLRRRRRRSTTCSARRSRPGRPHAAAPAPVADDDARGLPRPARRRGRAAPSATTTPRSTTPGSSSPSPAPPPASARPCVTSARVDRVAPRRRRGEQVIGVRVRDLDGTGSSFDGARAHASSPPPACGATTWRRCSGAGRAPACRCAPPRASTWWSPVASQRRGPHRRGRADPAHADLGAVRHPVGRPLDHRHHRHRLAAGPRPPGRRRRATSPTCSTRSTRCSTGR